MSEIVMLSKTAMRYLLDEIVTSGEGEDVLIEWILDRYPNGLKKQG